MELEKKIKRGEAILAYWRQWLIDYRKQHPKVEGDAKSDNAKAVKPETMTPEELVSIRKGLELSQKDMAFKLDISKRQLIRLEHGKCLISKAIRQKADLLQAKTGIQHRIPPKCHLPTRIKSSFSGPEIASPRLTPAQQEMVTFCRNCGAPFRIGKSKTGKTNHLDMPPKGTVPGPCPVCLKSPLVVSQEQRVIAGRQVGAKCPYNCSVDCRYQLGSDRLKCGLGLIPVVEVGLPKLEDVA
jgi:DNA-binding transcriptional regulator YiaG